MEILATLHPENNPNDDLFPNVKKENIPSKAINLEKLSDEVKNKLPKVISSDNLLPATKLKYLKIDGVTYSIPQRVDVTSNIKITGNKSDILSSPKNLLCILSDTNSLAIRVIDKIEGGSEEMSTLSTVLPQGLYGACCSALGDYVYIFGGYTAEGIVNKIYKFNTKNKTIESLSTILPRALYSACCSIYGDNIYIFGGAWQVLNPVNTIYKFNTKTETIETLSTTLPQKLNNACCSIFGDNIYIFGGHNGDNIVNTIYKFNCTNETISTISITLPQVLHRTCCEIYGDYVYIFGGWGSSNYVNTIYKFNCTNETISTLSTTLPQSLDGVCCSIYNDNIYIFGGRNSSGYVNTIYKFNCSTETIETINTTLPQVLYMACCSIFGHNIYIFGGYNDKFLNTIYNFSTTFELTANNVLIYNANSKYSFDLITDQVTIPIKNIYIGDSNNTAQLANAYLYDETQTAWVNVNTGELLTL